MDSDNELIEPLLIRYELYCEEVEREESLYAETLVQNSIYFINIVNDMMTLNSYAEMKPLFDEAYALYFALDASVPGAEEAIDSFDAVYDMVSLIEEHSRGLIVSAALLADAYGDEAVFALLVECCYYAEKADLGYAGVREAMAVYNSEYSKYCGKINQANTEIGEAVHTVGSLRASSGEGVVAVFIKKISR